MALLIFISLLGINTNDGCGIQAPNGTYNTMFNQAGGGVFVLEWDREKFIRVWNFVHPNVPNDLLSVFKKMTINTIYYRLLELAESKSFDLGHADGIFPDWT